jgi:hypothetical protein
VQFALLRCRDRKTHGINVCLALFNALQLKFLFVLEPVPKKAKEHKGDYKENTKDYNTE